MEKTANFSWLFLFLSVKCLNRSASVNFIDQYRIPMTTGVEYQDISPVAKSAFFYKGGILSQCSSRSMYFMDSVSLAA
jgi:hypothetical protein